MRLPPPDNKDISYEDLKVLLEKGQSLLLVDVRSKEEVDKGRILGSIHIPGEDHPLIFVGKKEYSLSRYAGFGLWCFIFLSFVLSVAMHVN